MRRYYLIIFCFLFISCKKEEINQSIVGRWEWQETHYNFRGSTPYTITPNSTDTSMIVKVNPESIEIYKNGIYFGEFNYTIIEDGNVIIIDYKKPFLGLRVYHGPITVENGKLYIAGGFVDAGGSQVFVRQK